MRGRRLCWLLVLAGLVIGTFADAVPHRDIPRAGEYLVLAGDFHVHAFPGDGTLHPWALRAEAARQGLDVYAITGHNNRAAARLWERFGGSAGGPLVMSGEEITNPGYHMIAVGTSRVVRGDSVPAAAAVADVHAQGGVAIAAHPVRRFWNAYDDGVVAQLDGSEAAHPDAKRFAGAAEAFDAFFARGRARAADGSFAAIGSSDVHIAPRLGASRTYLLVRERSAAGVLEAIRAGRTVGSDVDGTLHGDPGLVRLIEGHRPAGPVATHQFWRWAALALTWAGVLGTVLL